MVTALSLTVGILALAYLFSFVTRIFLYGMNFLDLGHGQTGLSIHLLKRAAQVATVIAAVACIKRRSWGRKLIILGTAGDAISSVLQLLVSMWNLWTNPRLAQFASGYQMSFDLLNVMFSVVAVLTLPALLIWVMTREPVRRQFGRRVEPRLEE